MDEARPYAPPPDDEFEALAKRLLADATAGCCMNDEWRGHPCTYHEGFDDGMDVLIQALTTTTREETTCGEG